MNELMLESVKTKMKEFLENNEYIQHLGIEMLEMEMEHGLGRMPFKSSVLNPYGSVHGGVLYSFADIVTGTIAAIDEDGGRFASTVNGSLNFLEAAKDTEYLYCRATCIRNGLNLSVYKAEILDDSGKLLDEGTFTFYKSKIKVVNES